MSDNKGSEWHRWDLHVHSPASFLRNEHSDWGEYINALERAPKEIKAIAITDYGTIEGYKKVKECKDKGQLKNIDLILPNIELRIQSPEGSSTSNKGVDIHLIFNPGEDDHVKNIERCLGNLKYNNDTGEYNCKPDEFKRLGESMDADENLSDESALKEGYNNFRPSIENYREWFEKEKWLKQNCLVGICSSDASALAKHNGYTDVAKQIRQFAGIMFSGNPSDVKYFLGKATDHPPDEVIKEVGSLKPCVHGCDKHKAEELFQVAESRYCWIKADRTFEGLKQIIYDPESRVHIGKRPPRSPINTIDTIKLNIPEDAKLGEEPFCYAEVNQTLTLSPYFNCFIGGRGSGKSTILNLLGLESNNPSASEKFWEQREPNFLENNQGNSFEDEIEESNKAFSIDHNGTFEFLAQSEIESFAKNVNDFTHAIYERVKAFNVAEEFDQITDDIEYQQKKIREILQAITNIVGQQSERKTKENTKNSYEKIAATLNSSKYIELNKKVKEKAHKHHGLEVSKNRVSNLQENLDQLINELPKVEQLKQSSNSYNHAYTEAINEIEKIKGNLDINKTVFKKDAQEIESLKRDVNKNTSKIADIIRELGYKAESVEQFKNAPGTIITLKAEIDSHDKNIKKLVDYVNKSDEVTDLLNGKREEFEKKLNESLKSLKEFLRENSDENQGRDLKRISLEYKFDDDRAWEKLADEFLKEVDDGSNSILYSNSANYICGHRDTLKYDDRKDRKKIIESLEKNDKQSQYIVFLKNLFVKNDKCKKFELIRDKHLTDVNEYMTIQVSYDGQDISKASFGQRCTAVIVIMMLFGNRPLIIDEPEAHLDNSLIANYLVPLLKRKKLERQIIFATHNANFVINGDTEKIFILENEDGTTQITESTIENLKHRGKLLKLEGGEEAFQKRGEKLAIY